MTYLYIDDCLCQSDTPPKARDIEAVIDGDLQVIRFKDGNFEEFTPIDEEDSDNWTIITEAI